MSPTFKSSKIMYLKGIYVKDIKPIDDIFDEKIMEKINVITPTAVSTRRSKPNPKQFKNWETWPKISNCLCWWCTLRFSSTPIPIPLSVYVVDGVEFIETEGNFCDFHCMIAYVETFYRNDSKYDDIMRLAKILYRRKYNRRVEVITPAPSPKIMEMYSGAGGLSPNAYIKLKNDIVNNSEFFGYKAEHMNKYNPR